MIVGTEEKKRILVVDDTIADVEVLVLLLTEYGDYEVNVANNGKQALESMSKVKPDLVLLDIMMPVMGGYETCSIMKADENLHDIPVLFLTANTEAEDLVKAFNAGGADYVTKPFNSIELIARIKTQLALKSSVDLVQAQVRALAETENKLRKKLKQIESDLERAHIVQEMLLPESVPHDERFCVSYRYKPMDIVGGDYISFPRLGNDVQGFIIGDLIGHGVSAALYMTLVKFVTDNLYQTCGRDPKELLKNMNRRLFKQMSPSFFTSIYGVLLLDESADCVNCVIAGAAHPKPIVYDSDSKVHAFKGLTSSTAIGLFPELTTENIELSLSSKSRLYLYTDGLTEALDENGNELGRERFLDIVSQSYDESLEDTLDHILKRVDEFSSGSGSTDDITLLAIEMLV